MIMLSIPATPLQEKLDVLAGQIGNAGMAAAGATFVAMLAIWFIYPSLREPVRGTVLCRCSHC